ncbi:alpha-glucan family phosphorylase [Chitinophaga sedimenti]|uniref:alpha-glucan family phosphorylase n=1 Tax=Chitinophaga sedimenti TaxID=2033606 RepID=UPI00200681DD|nr:alpha-glucan family phosphorylase [Chitinophaga sedimenti]MCK7557151.1 alpha-glucan family phosphorylase [Chitinophaga sedimenti]
MPEHPAPQPVWREVNVAIDVLPALQPLIELAENLWWSWHRIARELFAYADKICGTCVKDTPHLLPGSLDYQAMQRLLNTPRFMTLLDGVMELYRQEMASAPSGPLVAYFSPEYAIYQPLKIYAGGLGILSGDYLKTVADQHGNMVAIGLLYRSGYFKQQLSPAGEQVALPDTLQPEQLPLTAVLGKDGTPLIITLPFPGRLLHACAWLVKIGGVSLYLIDTQVPQNSTEDARITTQLYPADINVRLQQQLLLGMGGIRLLEALSIQPDVYHINEGHAAFAGLERINQLMRREHWILTRQWRS